MKTLTVNIAGIIAVLLAGYWFDWRMSVLLTLMFTKIEFTYKFK